VKRGEIWWAELPPPVGNRPVIILTRDAVLENIGSIVLALVTRTIRQLCAFDTCLLMGDPQPHQFKSLAF
jgi:mRNA-degrading endonuclease toxin of MazEF toxin-antitoxin module